MEKSRWEAGMITNFMQRSRMADKVEENNAKPPVFSSDAVQTADFIFSSIQRGIGDSGSLLLAKRKANRREQYLVKHAFTDCACNEFVYTKLAQAMGYHMPDVVLFQLSPGEKRKCFQTEYIIGAHYLNLVDTAPSFQKIREQALNWGEYFCFAALYAMTGEGDGLETPLADDQYIYRVDTADAFPLSNYQLDIAGINGDFDGMNPKLVIRDRLLSGNFEHMLRYSDCDWWLEQCIELGGEKAIAAFLEPFERIQEIQSDYIGDYFKRYLSALQRESAKYLKAKR